MYMNFLTFLGHKNPVLKFLNSLSSRALIFYEPLSYKKSPVIFFVFKVYFLPPILPFLSFKSLLDIPFDIRIDFMHLLVLYHK